MTAAGTGTCDGCDREGPVQQLEEVVLPSGPMVVCPECRYHAEELAERSSADCEGCGDAVTAATLSRTELPDGTEMVLCADCRETVEAGETPEDATAEAGTPDGAASEGATPESGTSERATADPDAATDSTDARTASGDSAASESGARTGSAGAGSSGTESSGTGSAAGNANTAGDAVADGATGKPATTQNTCDQCGGLYSIELYQVVTVDGRTEQFCPDCKDEGIDEGIVRDVELRRAQAYEALGLEGSADGNDVRQAYLEQVKEVHPDRSDGSRSEFMLVQQAYERLRDD